MSRWLRALTVVGLLAFPAAGRIDDPPIRARFHHVHLNSVSPDAAVDFYTRVFDTTVRATVAGISGLQSEDVYLLFDHVSAAPSLEPPSAVWHFGWGSPTPAEDVRKHEGRGISFYSPIAKLPSGTEFAYMKGPDDAMIEINTGRGRAFTHVHMFSDDPITAGEWYESHLGAERRGGTVRIGAEPVPYAAPSEPGGVIRSPNATVRLGDVSFIIYPRQKPGLLVSTRGHVVDHIGVSYPDVAAALARLERAGVTILEPIHPFGSGRERAAMVEGPDHIAIELVGM